MGFNSPPACCCYHQALHSMEAAYCRTSKRCGCEQDNYLAHPPRRSWVCDGGSGHTCPVELKKHQTGLIKDKRRRRCFEFAPEAPRSVRSGRECPQARQAAYTCAWGPHGGYATAASIAQGQSGWLVFPGLHRVFTRSSPRTQNTQELEELRADVERLEAKSVSPLMIPSNLPLWLLLQPIIPPLLSTAFFFQTKQEKSS